MKKFSILVLYSLLLAYFVASYSYKKGFGDSAATTTYITLAENYVSLFLLRNKTTEESLKYYESQLPHNISIHRNLIEEQSPLHGKLDNGQNKPNLEYYKKIQEYLLNHPNEKFNEYVIKDINWLVENEEGIF